MDLEDRARSQWEMLCTDLTRPDFREQRVEFDHTPRVDLGFARAIPAHFLEHRVRVGRVARNDLEHIPVLDDLPLSV